MTYLALVAARDGRRAGFATVAGVALGLAIIGIVAAFGVAELVQSSPLLYEGLRWAGVLFLLYLAWEGWTAGTDVAASDSQVARALFHPRPRHQSAQPQGRGLLRRGAADLHRRITAGAAADHLAHRHLCAGRHHRASAIVGLAGTLEPLLNDPSRERIARACCRRCWRCVALWFAWSTAR